MSKAYDLEQRNLNLKIEKLEGRKRRVCAKMPIFYPLEQVWQVLTDYETWPEFMPNLVQCKRLDSPTGGVRLEKLHTKNFMGIINFSDRSVFDVEEKFPHKVHYELFEGGMKAYSGDWRLEPLSLPESEVGIDLTCDFVVCPNRLFPMIVVEQILSRDVPAGLLAVRQRVEDIFGS